MKIGSGSPGVSKSECCRRRMVAAGMVVLLLWVGELRTSEGQQDYEDNKQLDCYNNHTATYGYTCGKDSVSSCSSYLTFRSSPPSYDNVTAIGSLLGATPSLISRFNNVSGINPIPKDTLLTVPVNCTCSKNNDSYYYQHFTTYTLNSDETYLAIANNTYEGLTACQALIALNPSHDSRNLFRGLRINVPLRCACPSPNQTSASIRHLLTYVITPGDTIDAIARTSGVALQSVLDANKLSKDSTIYPFTTILVPLKTALAPRNALAAPPPPLMPPPPPELPLDSPGGGGGNSSNSSGHKWVFVGVGIGAALLFFLLSGSLVFFFARRRHRSRQSTAKSKESVSVTGGGGHKLPVPEPVDYSALPVSNKSWSVSPEGVRYAVESLTLYQLEELEQATNFFSESNTIKDGVYRGYFNGDCAAIKMMKGDVSDEINILKQINHSNIIRLSGFCMHEANTYLVYEYADNGSLSDWLRHDHHDGTRSKHGSESVDLLGWKQRVQIAYDIADALNYLHNYINPPYIHKNLKRSNVLLDRNLRAKVTNFGLARSLENEEKESGLVHLTRHVVGTHGYMPPEYIENGVVTPKLDVFAFGVVMLELLSGREAAPSGSVTATANNGGLEGKEKRLLSAAIHEVLGGENVRDKLRDFMDPSLGREYPFDLAFSMAQLAMNCVAPDLNARPTIADAFISLSKLLSTSLDWDPSNELDRSPSLCHAS